ncbi:branched-chain amino acid ABC transporter permease [Streptomyces sp. S6]|nr:branched-chain amino acid ABC transporter permease [Streptomyces sp. S6]
MTTTQTTTKVTAPAPAEPATSGILALPPHIARATATAGGAITVISAFLAWTWTSAFPGDLTVYGYPGGLQWLVLVSGALLTLFGLSSYGIKGLTWLTPQGADPAIRLAAYAALATAWFSMGAIATTLGGVVNLEPGAYVALAGTLIGWIGARSLPYERPETTPADPEDTGFGQFKHNLGNRWETYKGAFTTGTAAPAKTLPSYVEILIVAVVLALGLVVFTYGITTEYDELFIGFLITAGFGFAAIQKAGLIQRVSALTARHRNVTLVGAFAAAAAFPFTQSDDQYATIGVNILIFATVALGLNIVVGLAGLLDLGYVAFLGVGAYAAALVSGSPTSPFGIHLPFWQAILVGAVASMIFGVLIGAPTLRLRGDYLAIVTLGFGEIFRIAVLNLDGTSGPDVTNGSNGISSIPNLNLFGFDFGATHTIAGFTIGRFANYFFLMLLVGATLAGLAGAVQAHVTYTVTPEQYQFAHAVPPNSAFLLAAVVLGGMGTISGPLVGGALLFLIPAKLQFMSDYQLFAFGLALVLLMRFRPEGLIANRRQQLEFHEKDEAPATLTKAGA